MKKSMKIVSILLMIAMLAVVVSPVVFADDLKPSNFVKPDTNNTDSVSNVGNRIAGIIKVVGMFAAVIAIMFVGVKYMMGSAEEKAEYKKSFIPLIIGIVVVFGATYIAQLIFSIAG